MSVRRVFNSCQDSRRQIKLERVLICRLSVTMAGLVAPMRNYSSLFFITIEDKQYKKKKHSAQKKLLSSNKTHQSIGIVTNGTELEEFMSKLHLLF